MLVVRVGEKSCEEEHGKLLKSNLMSVMGFQVFVAPGYYNHLVSPHDLFILDRH